MQNGTKANGTVNGVHRNPAIIGEHELSWDGLSPNVVQALSQPLDPSLLSQRKGRAGRTYDYLEGHVAIDQANRIFGFGGWGYELVGDVTLRRVETVDTKTGDVSVSQAYSAPVRVTVAGAQPRTDVGFHAVSEGTPEGHDTALKGAVTDGMKRALRGFGVQFGNSLYGDHTPATTRGNSHSTESGDSAQSTGSDTSDLPALRKRLINLGADRGFKEEQVKEAVKERTGKSLGRLSKAELIPLVESAERKLRETQKAA